LIFAVDQSELTNKKKRELTDKCLHNYIEVKEVPPINHWIKGELQTKFIRTINIVDLLGRDAIQLDRQKIEEGLKNSVVLVTGAAGSIGSEIVQQLIRFHVRQVILLDKAESDMFNLQQEIKSSAPQASFDVVICDVTNLTRLKEVFRKHRPDIVYHAAAYKHVPLMEEFPGEAIRTNVGGTKNIADLSVRFGVKKFVFISTDKAVNPSNVMGATKRISEIYIQSLAQSGKYATKFITTRFGNVLGSNGSVVPLFTKQIQKGGPVTVTHKEVTRYFMTIPEACQLVLEAGFMGQGGEIYVFDMGKPIRIYDLACKMILLSGYVPEKDIKIEVVGLRPGEKLYEELLDNKEELLPTYNNKIMIAKIREHDEEMVNIQVNGILHLVDEKNCYQLVSQIKAIVPEFVPMNSFYSSYIQNPEPAKLLQRMVNLLKQYPVQDILIKEVKTPRAVTNPVHTNSHVAAEPA
jgi:FlaA1/EpsC-like NDP-sugar epimerase